MPTARHQMVGISLYRAAAESSEAFLQLYQYLFGPLPVLHPADSAEQIEKLESAHKTAVESLQLQIKTLSEQREKLQAEVANLKYRNHQLLLRNRELEALQTKDSHNSSRPPSSDPTWKKRTRSLRRPSGRSPGGQKGHPGHYRPLSSKPNRVQVLRARVCHHCHSSLNGSPVTNSERRQLIDIIPAKVRVTEYVTEIVRCTECGKKTKAEFPEDVRAAVEYGPSVRARALYLQQYQLLPFERTAEAMRDLFGCSLSTGTLANMVKSCSEGLIETELKIKRKLRRSPLIHLDETGIRVENNGHYIHVTSNSRLTHYAVDSRRGSTAMQEIGILPHYRGRVVHDGWVAYKFYTECKHSLCVGHLLRELTFFEELNEEQQHWASGMKALLREIKAKVAEAIDAGRNSFCVEEEMSYSNQYDEIVREGLNHNPATAMPGAESQITAEQNMEAQAELEQSVCQGKARSLLLRFERRKEEVLRFMRDFSVPFDNNQAERDLRMVKLKAKTSGCFRAEEGARDFCRIRSYLSTMRKQGRGMLKAIERAMEGRPFCPTS